LNFEPAGVTKHHNLIHPNGERRGKFVTVSIQKRLGNGCFDSETETAAWFKMPVGRWGFRKPYLITDAGTAHSAVQ
jgi:hypothetical protein